MQEMLTQILLSLCGFIGVTIIYFLKMSFQKLEIIEVQIHKLELEIERLKRK